MIFRRAVLLSSSVVAAIVLPACLELDTTNGGGGGDGQGSAEGGSNGSSSSGGGLSSSSSSSGNVDTCSSTMSCDGCVVCSGQTSVGMCTKEYQACQMSADCKALDACIHGCAPGDFMCLELCYGTYPMAASDYQNYDSCVCNECFASCSGNMFCGG